VHGKIVKSRKDWDGKWKYTVEDSKKEEIKEVDESKLSPE